MDYIYDTQVPYALPLNEFISAEGLARPLTLNFPNFELKRLKVLFSACGLIHI